MSPALPASFLRTPIAHRALHGPDRPENSRAAVRAAVARGFGIEIDLQLSADGVAMVFHDAALGRLTEALGPVRERTAGDLGAITLRGGAEGIPTLAQVLADVGGQVPLLVELKDQSGTLGPTDGALERATAEAVEGYAGPLAVMSFNPHAVAELARLLPHVPRGLTTSPFDPRAWPGIATDRLEALARIEDVDTVQASFISHAARDLANPRVAELKARGLPILCWTIRSAAEESEARRIADNVTFEGYLPA